MATYREIAVHSAEICFLSIRTYLLISFFSLPRLLEWEFLSHCAISRLLPTFTFKHEDFLLFLIF